MYCWYTIYKPVHGEQLALSPSPFFSPNPIRFSVCDFYRNKMKLILCQVHIRAIPQQLQPSEDFKLWVSLHPVWWKAVACASAADPLLFSTLSAGSGVLAEQNSMASGHVGAACWTSKTLLPNKHSCSETMLLLECSKQGNAAGFDP